MISTALHTTMFLFVMMRSVSAAGWKRSTNLLWILVYIYNIYTHNGKSTPVVFRNISDHKNTIVNSFDCNNIEKKTSLWFSCSLASFFVHFLKILMVFCCVLQIEEVCDIDHGYPIITQGNFMLMATL